MKDDGKGLRDEPNDNVYVAWIEAPAQKKIQLAIADDGVALGALMVELPSGTDSVVDIELVSMKLSVPKGGDEYFETKSQTQNPSVTDQIAVTLTLDDRILKRLDQPEIRYGSNRSAPLRDDGLQGDAEAGDRLFLAQFSVSRDEYMSISVWDSGTKKGSLSVFLPSSNTASVRLRTTMMKLVCIISEPQSQSQIDSPVATSGTSGRSAGSCTLGCYHSFCNRFCCTTRWHAIEMGT